jgi:hypothetical protein
MKCACGLFLRIAAVESRRSANPIKKAFPIVGGTPVPAVSPAGAPTVLVDSGRFWLPVDNWIDHHAAELSAAVFSRFPPSGSVFWAPKSNYTNILITRQGKYYSCVKIYTHLRDISL